MTTSGTTRWSVLIVDDCRDTRSMVAQLLELAGYAVRQAGSGEEGLAVLASSPPDAVLLDLEMPGISGLELLRRLGNGPRLYAVILLTAQSAVEEICAGLDLGADDYVVKPFQALDLLARLRAALRGVRHLRDLVAAQRETECTLVELKVAQTQRIEQEKVAVVARLAAGAAHNINNPLGFVMSNISALERYSATLLACADRLAGELHARAPESGSPAELLGRRVGELREDLPGLFQETREGCQRMALIVQQLAQLELGFASHSCPLDLAALVRHLVQRSDAMAPAGTRFACVTPEHPVMVHAAEPLINSALTAVLKNACEALGTTPGRISVTLGADAGQAELTVLDSGPGVAAEHLGLLFEPFFTTKHPESHVGLGLTIAERFISGHGGQIVVSSAGDGTCARILLPLLTGS